MSSKTVDFTQGKILSPLLKFALPILGALLLQATYGAVDVIVVGQFCSPADVSAVAIGSNLMHTVQVFIIALAMGTTVLLGQRLGEGRADTAGSVIGNSIWLFAAVGLLLTALLLTFSDGILKLMQTPAEALVPAKEYFTICAIGAVFIVAYNVLGSVFRGIGDSKTPLIAVCIACVCNIGGDLYFVTRLKMGAAGAALATVISQGISVVLCLLMIRKKGLPFYFGKSSMTVDRDILKKVLKFGFPLALQELLVSGSFLVLAAIVNSLGVIASAGLGVAQKLIAYIMLVASSFSQALAAFVAQNVGAGKEQRGSRAMLYGMLTSFAISIFIAWSTFFHGDVLCRLFASDSEVIAAGYDYMRAYSIDVLQTSFLFCFIGYFNGCGKTRFTMIQGLFGAFVIRIPVAFYMSTLEPVSLFNIALATPTSTFFQIAVCVIYFIIIHKKKPAEV